MDTNMNWEHWNDDWFLIVIDPNNKHGNHQMQLKVKSRLMNHVEIVLDDCKGGLFVFVVAYADLLNTTKYLVQVLMLNILVLIQNW